MIKDQSEERFNHLFKRKMIKDADGNLQEMNLYELHWDKEDTDTAQAILDGKVNDEDLEIAKEFIEILEGHLIEAIRNQSAGPDGDGVRMSEIEAEKMLYDNYGYRRGMMPGLSQSFAEAFTKGLSSKDAYQMTVGLLDKFNRDSMTEYGLFEFNRPC